MIVLWTEKISTKSYKFVRFFRPKLGRFVYRHKGNVIMVDNILKPVRSIASSLAKTVVKPLPKKHFNPVFCMLVIN